MKVLAVNGSPRKNYNTAKLLEKMVEGAISEGAEAEVVHLGDLHFTGCVSCFACKKIGGPSYGRCVLTDELTPVLQKAHEADVLVLGTPFYLAAETSLMRAFEERLFFQYLLYSNIKKPLSPRKKATALIYTMNIKEEEISAPYTTVIDIARMLMERQFGPCTVFLSCDTLQFNDYSQYEHDMFDAPAKQKRHREVFPTELQHAFELGSRLVK